MKVVTTTQTVKSVCLLRTAAVWSQPQRLVLVVLVPANWQRVLPGYSQPHSGGMFGVEGREYFGDELQIDERVVDVEVLELACPTQG